MAEVDGFGEDDSESRFGKHLKLTKLIGREFSPYFLGCFFNYFFIFIPICAEMIQDMFEIGWFNQQLVLHSKKKGSARDPPCRSAAN